MTIEKEIFVTRPSLPLFDDFIPYLKEIWESKWLTNQGKFHQQFERELADYLGVKFVSLFANGTLALITALQVIRISGEVITTPFSFVATAHALHWNGIRPIFCDIEPVYFNIDPEKIESAITPRTTAILPVHVYGNPCDVEKIQKVADVYGLKVIYDACHAFGVNKNNISICNYGDLSVLSFHATKVFTTFEGGAIICHDEKTKKRVDFLKNFGFADEVTVVAPGINAKMNEFQAALGILQIKEIEKNIEKRKRIACYYRERLKNVRGLKFLPDIEGVKHNYSYFPILLNENECSISRDDLYKKLRGKHIYVRRYFYPLISDFPTYRGLPSASQENLSVAKKIAQSILCLPIYPELSFEDIDDIIRIIIH